MKKGILLFGLIAVFLSQCKDDPELPHNPFDDINYQINPPPPDTTDPNSFVWLHKEIFQPKCATPGCHDGSFEPDFRTIQSAYNTLVFHPLVKYDTSGYFQYRVRPFDVNRSWLHERVVTDNAVLGRMPLYSTPLTAAEVGKIDAWIQGGAKDILGQSRELPNNEPVFAGYVCYTLDYSQRPDTNRVGDVAFNSFIVNSSTTYQLMVLVTDDSTAVSALQNFRVKFSTNPDNFSSATTVNGSFLNIGGFQVWKVNFSTNAYPSGTTVYFRAYINDGDHPQDTEFPNEEINPAYKTYCSFYVQ